MSAATVGAVVASRRPAHPVGWLLLAFGLLAITSLVAGGIWGAQGAVGPAEGDHRRRQQEQVAGGLGVQEGP